MSLPATSKPIPKTASGAAEELSLLRLYLLRAGYLLMALGLVITRWPLLIGHDASWPLMDGVVVCMLVALSLLFFLGVRYPVKLIPVLLFEMTWKVIWLSTVALPLRARAPSSDAIAHACWSGGSAALRAPRDESTASAWRHSP